MILYGPIYEGPIFPFLQKLINPFMGDTFKNTQSPKVKFHYLFLMFVHNFYEYERFQTSHESPKPSPYPRE